jgi:hypothetical protein
VLSSHITNDKEDALNSTPVTDGATTVTAHVAVKPPSRVVAVMVTGPPIFSADTLPSVTVAIVSSLELHSTVASKASRGFTVATRVLSIPIINEKEEALNSTPVTATFLSSLLHDATSDAKANITAVKNLIVFMFFVLNV